MALDPDEARLARLARAQEATITDLELAEVWDVLCREIECGHLPAEGWFSIASIVEVLVAGSGRGVNELWVDVDDETPDPERVTVGSGFVLPKRLGCAREPLIAELRRLLARHRAQP
ncbi:MAG: hypothetical protein R3B09_06805 [Nannocystaceae bacterium]